MDVRELITIAKPVRLAALRLQTDDYWPKMNTEDRQYYIEESLAAGDRTAGLFLEEFRDADIRTIASETEIRIRKDERPMVTETPDFSAAAHHERRRILIHGGVATALIELLRHFSLQLSEEEAIRFLFLRGFYYLYAAERHLLPTQTLEPVRIRVLLRDKAFPVRTADKAAGDRFVDLVSDLPVPAGLLPYLQLVKEGRADLTAVRKILEEGATV